MTPDQLKSAAIELFGERGWTTALALHLGVDRTQIWRYVSSTTPVPGPVAAAVECWLDRYRSTGNRPGEQKGPPRSNR